MQPRKFVFGTRIPILKPKRPEMFQAYKEELYAHVMAEFGDFYATTILDGEYPALDDEPPTKGFVPFRTVAREVTGSSNTTASATSSGRSSKAPAAASLTPPPALSEVEIAEWKKFSMQRKIEIFKNGPKVYTLIWSTLSLESKEAIKGHKDYQEARRHSDPLLLWTVVREIHSTFYSENRVLDLDIPPMEFSSKPSTVVQSSARQ
jgi:hypothetical protein